MWQGTEIEIVGAEAVGPLAPRAFDLRTSKIRLDDADDGLRDLVLQIEDVFQRAVVSIGPENCIKERKR
jgi:hypothetical protein